MKDSELERYRQEVGWWLLSNNHRKDFTNKPEEALRQERRREVPQVGGSNPSLGTNNQQEE